MRGIMRDMPDPNFSRSSSTQLRHADSLSDFVIASPSVDYVEQEVVQDFESSGFTLFDASESKSMHMPCEVCAVKDDVAVHDAVGSSFVTP